jgi:hypothetical protein
MRSKDHPEGISTEIKNNLDSNIKLEELIDDALLISIPKELRTQPELYHGQSDLNKNDDTEMDEPNHESFTEFNKNEVTREINEATTTGFLTPSFFLEVLVKLSKLRLSKYMWICF